MSERVVSPLTRFPDLRLSSTVHRRPASSPTTLYRSPRSSGGLLTGTRPRHTVPPDPFPWKYSVGNLGGPISSLDLGSLEAQPPFEPLDVPIFPVNRLGALRPTVLWVQGRTDVVMDLTKEGKSLGEKDRTRNLRRRRGEGHTKVPGKFYYLPFHKTLPFTWRSHSPLQSITNYGPPTQRTVLRPSVCPSPLVSLSTLSAPVPDCKGLWVGPGKRIRPRQRHHPPRQEGRVRRVTEDG